MNRAVEVMEESEIVKGLQTAYSKKQRESSLEEDERDSMLIQIQKFFMRYNTQGGN